MLRKIINATLCYLKQDNQTLMLHRVKKQNDYHQNKYNGLGGKFEFGESPEDCLLREVKEESGLDLIDINLHGIITFPLFDGENDWIAYIYTSSKWSGEMIESPEGDLEWIADENLKNLPLWEGDHIFMKWLEQDRFFSAKFIYTDKKLLRYEVKFY